MIWFAESEHFLNIKNNELSFSDCHKRSTDVQ